jgi:hypothetical protein
LCGGVGKRFEVKMLNNIPNTLKKRTSIKTCFPRIIIFLKNNKHVQRKIDQ